MVSFVFTRFMRRLSVMVIGKSRNLFDRVEFKMTYTLFLTELLELFINIYINININLYIISYYIY